MIVCDMDEWLCVKEKDLIKEDKEVVIINYFGELQKYVCGNILGYV